MLASLVFHTQKLSYEYGPFTDMFYVVEKRESLLSVCKPLLIFQTFNQKTH